MAIIQNKEADGLRFGKLENLYQESIVQENYTQDMIRNYGVDIRYYKLKTFYPEVFKPILDSNHLSIHAYGEEFAQEWEDPMRMVAYIKWDSDEIILNSYGIQPDSTMTMWLNQTDFAIAMSKKLAQLKEYKVVGNSEFILDFGAVGYGDGNGEEDLMKNKDEIYISFQTDLFDGVLHAIVTDNTLNELLVHDHCPVLEQPICIPCDIVDHGSLKIDTGRINPLLYKGDHYDPFQDEMVDCHLHLEVVSILKDKHGCIRIMGGIRGAVVYHDTTVIGKYIEKVGPEVGDLIDIPVPDENGNQVYKQKYEIVHIQETKTGENYMNPFLRKYIYEINLRAYVASGQEEPNGPSEKRVELQDKLDLINCAAENAAKKIGLYEDNEDNVYGGYHKVNKRTMPSVQRDASKSTINDFNPSKTKKSLKKVQSPLFIFKDYKMVLSILDDPRNNTTTLKLSPYNRKIQVAEDMRLLDHLRCSDDALVLVNGTQTYLLASMFHAPEIDEDTFCIKPTRLKHEVYAQKGGWADQPFSLVDRDDDIELDMNLQDLMGENTSPEWKSASENGITFPTTNSYISIQHDLDNESGNEVYTCGVVFQRDESQTMFPICSYVRKPRVSKPKTED